MDHCKNFYKYPIPLFSMVDNMNSFLLERNQAYLNIINAYI